MARKLFVEVIVDPTQASRGFRQAQRDSQHFNRELGRTFRGVAAGSGIFRGLGRSIAFASGGFLAFASAADVLRKSIEAGSQQVATERQLAAQFKASGLSLAKYRGEIDATTHRLSIMAGIQDDELQRSFITAFRGSKDVAVSLKIEGIAADVARGRHLGLAQSTLALTKAYGGQATALRRLGVLIPTNLKGMQALNFVAQKFAGQARAGTTEQQRFSAALFETEEAIGRALLPEFNRLLRGATRWLSSARNQKRVQDDVSTAVHGFATGMRDAVSVVRAISGPLGGLKNTLKLLGTAFIGLRLLRLATEIRGIATAWGLVAASAAGAATAEGAASGGFLARAGRTGRLAGVIRGGAIGAIAGATARGIGGAGIVAGAVLSSAGATPQHGDRRSRYPLTWQMILKASAGKQLGSIEQMALAQLGQQSFDSASDAQLRKAEKILATGVPSPLGENAMRNAQRDAHKTARGGGTHGTGRLGLRAQFSQLEVQLAQAGITPSTRDDRRILQQEAANLRKQLATRKLSFKDRNDLKIQLANVEQQIAQIDKQDAATVKQSRKAQVEARKQALKDRRAALRDQIAAIKQQFADAVQSARDAIGALFQGPLLNPSDSATKRILGVPGQSAQMLTADLNAQVAEAKRRQREIAAIVKRAPKGLRAELRKELGGIDMAQLDALAAPGMNLQPFFSAFRGRERLARQTARTELKQQLEVKVVLTGDLKKIAHVVSVEQSRRERNNAPSRRGHNAGRG